MKLKLFFLIGAMGFMVFCSEENSRVPPGSGPMPTMSIKEVLAQKRAALMAIPGVVGTGQGRCDGQPCIKVYVTARTPRLDKQISELLKNHRFVVQESGKFQRRPGS